MGFFAMKARRLISLTTMWSFLLLVLTGVVLYVVPPGRVAYWSVWHWMGLSKTQWGDLHVTSSALFCIVGIWHIYFNWAPILQYLKGRRAQGRLPSVELVVSLALTAVLCIGTYMDWPPFNWVIALGEHIKDAGSEKYGEPPYGHAELSSLRTLTTRMQLDLSTAMSSLRSHGIVINDESDILEDIAQNNNTTPNAIYDIILAGQPIRKGATSSLPATAPPGIGRQTLGEIAGKYGCDVGVIKNALQADGIQVDPDATLKAVAEQAGLRPTVLYEQIRNAVTNRDGE
jgi:hypothetical protein